MMKYHEFQVARGTDEVVEACELPVVVEHVVDHEVKVAGRGRTGRHGARCASHLVVRAVCNSVIQTLATR